MFGTVESNFGRLVSKRNDMFHLVDDLKADIIDMYWSLTLGTTKIEEGTYITSASPTHGVILEFDFSDKSKIDFEFSKMDIFARVSNNIINSKTFSNLLVSVSVYGEELDSSEVTIRSVKGKRKSVALVKDIWDYLLELAEKGCSDVRLGVMNAPSSYIERFGNTPYVFAILFNKLELIKDIFANLYEIDVEKDYRYLTYFFYGEVFNFVNAFLQIDVNEEYWKNGGSEFMELTVESHDSRDSDGDCIGMPDYMQVVYSAFVNKYFEIMGILIEECKRVNNGFTLEFEVLPEMLLTYQVADEELTEEVMLIHCTKLSNLLLEKIVEFVVKS